MKVLVVYAILGINVLSAPTHSLDECQAHGIQFLNAVEKAKGQHERFKLLRPDDFSFFCKVMVGRKTTVPLPPKRPNFEGYALRRETL